MAGTWQNNCGCRGIYINGIQYQDVVCPDHVEDVEDSFGIRAVKCGADMGTVNAKPIQCNGALGHKGSHSHQFEWQKFRQNEDWTEPCGCRGVVHPLTGLKAKNWSCIDHITGEFDKRADHQIREMDGTNPKDLIGVKKVSISKLPAVAILHASHAMMNGAEKFGAYNWRSKKVQAEIYIDAALRHITAWNEREEKAPDSGVHHLGHAMACLAILLDAQETGNLVDNRPASSNAYPKTLARLNDSIAKVSK